MTETLQERIQRVITEHVEIVPYNPNWPKAFLEEKAYLESVLPSGLVRRVEHFGSTAVPNLAAKPIIDMLVEVTDSEQAKRLIVPILENVGYEFFWRPGFQGEPYYAWFIKRDVQGIRTHHIHMVESDSQLWERLYFRDYLREFPEVAKAYAELKQNLLKSYSNDRVAYTEGKGQFVTKLTNEAVKYYS